MVDLVICQLSSVDMVKFLGQEENCERKKNLHLILFTYGPSRLKGRNQSPCVTFLVSVCSTKACVL